MAISREKKESLVKQYVDELNESDGIIITEYRGLTVADLEELRGKIREVEGTFSVIKNTLAQRALSEVGLPVPEDLLLGPVAIGFGRRNLTGVAKAITDYAKTKEFMVVKGGLIGESVITDKAVKDLADMPSIEVLRAQLLGLLNTPASQLVGVLSAPPREFATVLSGSVRQLVNVLSAKAAKDQE